jgi:hypothetical protein
MGNCKYGRNAFDCCFSKPRCQSSLVYAVFIRFLDRFGFLSHVMIQLQPINSSEWLIQGSLGV